MWPRAAGIAVLLAMMVYSGLHLDLSTDITNFLPEGENVELASVSRKLVQSDISRTMVLCIGAQSIDTAVEAAAALAARLKNHPEVAWIRTSIDADQLRAAYDLYFPRRYYFVSEKPEQIPQLLAAANLQQRARALKQDLAQPMAILLKQAVPADPLGSFRALVEGFGVADPTFAVYRDQFVTKDRQFAVILLRTRSSAFASGPQSAFLAEIERAFAEIRREKGGGLYLEQSGTNRFAVSAEQSIRSDLYLISAVSFAGIALLLFLFFRAPSHFFFSMLPPFIGFVVATTAGLLVFGRLDTLTLAFGTSLLGVAIDYPIHVLNHHALDAGQRSCAEVVNQLKAPLALACITTMASFAGLALTSFPGFREIGFFAMVGIGAAGLFTIYALPALLSPEPVDRARISLSVVTANAMARAVARLETARGPAAIAISALLLAGAAAFPYLGWLDDLSQLSRFDPGVQAESLRVQKRISPFDTNRFVIALAPTPEQAVERNEAAYQVLRRAIDAGRLEAIRNLHSYLWPQRVQQANWEQIRRDPDLYARVDDAFHGEGFRSGAFLPFRDALQSTPPPPLSFADLRDSPLSDLVSSMIFAAADQTAVVTYLRGATDVDALSAELRAIPGVYLFDQRRFVDELYAEFRDTTVRQLFVGDLLVVLVLFLRYRSWRATVAAFLPSVLAAAALIAIFALCGIQANLLHVVSVILIMGMAVDYGIYIVDGSAKHGMGATMLSLLLCTLATVFVFGTLALSSHPALRSIGLTTGLGIALALLFAPVAYVLMRPPGAEPGASR